MAHPPGLVGLKVMDETYQVSSILVRYQNSYIFNHETVLKKYEYNSKPLYPDIKA